jgi:hypothetical protein
MEHNAHLTSSEIGNLWVSYVNDSLVRCVLKYFLAKVEDEEIKVVLEQAYLLVNKEIQNVTEIFEKEQYALPVGFTDDDVFPSAPRLYSDSFFLCYINNMTKFALNAYTMALGNSARPDVRHLYSEMTRAYIDLYNKTSDIFLSKGMLLRSPSTSGPEKVEFVEKQSFLNGWFGERRPLNVIEISHLHSSIIRNMIGKALLLGFSQTAESEEVRDYMTRGKNIAGKHMEVFTSILSENDLTVSMTWMVTRRILLWRLFRIS